MTSGKYTAVAAGFLSIAWVSSPLPAFAQHPPTAAEGEEICAKARVAEPDLDDVEACTQMLVFSRRLPEGAAMADRGVALALKRHGEKSKEYAYALRIHGLSILMTGNGELSAKEMQRADEISESLPKE